jgi:translocation and assembly module TamB
MNLDVAVVIPSGLWIRGRGLEVELAGELDVAQKGKTLPTITGRLNAVRGQLVFLGRIFRIEKGEVVFYGGDEIDPSVDLLLSARVGDVVIRILFTGTAQQPVLELTSDPEMTEGDIMAYLLFGRPLEELSSNQSEFLQSRAVDVAASYPLAKLEERLARSLGVDMMSIRRAEGTDSQSALVVGKYLTRRALFKYEQALESATSFFINLEYMLSRHFKLETLIGTQGKSGIEIGWSK